MAITRPRDNISTTAGSATPACSFATLPAAGSCVIVGWASWKGGAYTHNSVADNQGGTYTQIGTTITINDSGASPNIRLSLWKLDNISAPSGTFTVTATASATCDSRLVIAEYAGMATSTQDQTNQANGNSAAATTTLSTTTNANDVLVGVLTAGAAGTVTMTEDATNLPTLVREDQDNNTNQCINVAERIVSATGAYTGNWALTSGTWACNVVALKGSGAPDPTPTFVGAGTAAFTATNGATLAPGLPTGWAADDIHILLAHRSDNTAMTSLTGWTQLAALSGNNTAAQRVEVWWRRAVAGDAAPTITFGTSTVVRGARIYGVRGCPTSGSPFDTSTGAPTRSPNAASATVTFTDLTTTVAQCLVLALAAYEDDPTTLSTLTGYTNPAQGTNTSALGNDMGLYHQWKALATATTGGGGNGTVSGGTFANSVNVGLLLAFLPIVSNPTRTVAGSQPAATGILARILAALRALAGAQPSGTGTLTRKLAAPRALAGSQPAPTGVLTYVRVYTRSLVGAQPSPTGTLARILAAPRALAGSQPAATGTLVRSLGVFARALVGAQPSPTGTLTRILGAVRSLVGAQPSPTGTLTAQSTVSRTVAGSQPAPAGQLARVFHTTSALVGSEPAGTGTLARVLHALRALVGAQSSPAGTLTRSQGRVSTLAGSQPSPTGTLTAQSTVSRILAGSQPAPAGQLARILHAARSLAGSQPAAAGTLARLLVAVRALVGAQPAGTGTLTRSASRTRALTGAQPSPAATLSAQSTVSRSLTGSQPAPAGQLARLFSTTRLLAGSQPGPAGTLDRLGAIFATRATSTDAAYGAVVASDGAYAGGSALDAAHTTATADDDAYADAGGSVALVGAASGSDSEG